MFPVAATPMDHVPAFSPSSISAGVSPILAIAAMGYSLHSDGILVDHVGVRPAGAHVARSNIAIGDKACFSAGVHQQIEHLARVACGRADLQAAAAKALCRFHHARNRSEEHTSELQSLAYLVCRLLLEKKNRLVSCSDSVH